jgi:uncharacterized protein YjbI with pentapeptide repeats
LIAGIVAATALLLTTTASAAAPFVTVQAELTRGDGGAVVHAQVEWNVDAARAAGEMKVGDLRLVAVSDDGHHPTLLGQHTYLGIAEDPTEEVTLDVPKTEDAAIAAGNRVVLTASQHRPVAARSRSPRTFVTVDQLQASGSPQGRIGRDNCAGIAIEAGANLNKCDLVGADLEGATVSRQEPASSVSRMLLADLTGANLEGADLSGLSVAGGRMNGADMNEALFDNLSLSGTEATGLKARKASSGREKFGANIFDANLTGADFQEAKLFGVSLNHSRLDRANFQGATWASIEANLAGFRGADLRGVKFEATPPHVYFADFTDADLRGTPFTDEDLAWATLCHTVTPAGKPEELEDRDCRAEVEPPPKRGVLPKVAVEGSLERAGGRATIKAKVTWNAAAIAARMTVGDLRALVIDRATGVPEVLGARTIAKELSAPTDYELQITEPDQIAAIDKGDRVVLTATQHPPLPPGPSDRTNGSYVTVDTLQRGPGRGRVGARNCSDLLLSAEKPTPGKYDFCDLAGAVLNKASLAGTMRESDLTGAELSGAGLVNLDLAGSALGDADLTAAKLENTSLYAAWAPKLTLPKTRVAGAEWRGANFDEANFAGDTIADMTFATSSLRGANFDDARLNKVDLANTGLQGAKFERVNALSTDPQSARRTSLFLADLTGATLADSKWSDEESGDRPWQWSILCHTVLPRDAGISGDRDCPGPPDGP